MLAAKCASPLYRAVMECECAASVALVKAAVLFVRATVPNVMEPSLKMTVPVGVPDVEGWMVAVKVTARPYADGFAEETSDIEVGAEEILAVTSAELALSPDALSALTT